MPKPKLFQHVWTGVEQHQNSLIIVSSIIYYTDITISHVVSLGSRLDVSYLQPTVLDSIGTMVPYQTTFWELHGIATLIYLKLHVKYVNLPEHVLIPRFTLYLALVFRGCPFYPVTTMLPLSPPRQNRGKGEWAWSLQKSMFHK